MKYRLEMCRRLKRACFVCLFLSLIATSLSSQSNPVSLKTQTGSETHDLLTVAQANHSLSMFVAAVQLSGMAKVLRDEAPLTVYALSNQAFANLQKDDLEALLASPAAMNILLAHYIARGSIGNDDTPSLLSARTLPGAKLRTDIRSQGTYVNGAKLNQIDVGCANGRLHVLDTFDPGLARDAVALAKADRREK
jgi:transforming growth factor-beta-induced protein